MAVTTGISFILSSISWILVFSGMQMFKPFFVGSQLHTILGGYFGSIMFVFLLTSIGNLESIVFGKSFQMKLFPEISSCLVIAILASSTIHRVCGTTCLLISLCALYYINKYSQKVYTVPAPQPVVQFGKKKKHAS